MLTARGQKLLGRADLRWALVFSPRLWCVVVRREGLVLDTRLAPAATEPSTRNGCLYVLLEGVFEIHGGPRFEAPCAFVLSDEHLEGANGTRPFTFTANGDPYAAIELHPCAPEFMVQPSALPARVELDAATWDVARAVARLGDEEDPRRLDVTTLVERVASLGLVDPAATAGTRDGPSKAFEVLWRALRPMIERFYLTPTLQEVVDATGLSVRQAERIVDDFVHAFALVGPGWRPATRHLRLKLATILLSADGATVGEVASTVGYRSSDAMARAFRDAGMPPPTVVREQLRGAR